MISLGMVKPLGAILKKLNAKELMEKLGKIDFRNPQGQEELGKMLIGEIIEHLEDVADDLVRLCAAYKGITVAEAEKQDALKILKDLFSEDGIGDFFKRAAQ